MNHYTPANCDRINEETSDQISRFSSDDPDATTCPACIAWIKQNNHITSQKDKIRNCDHSLVSCKDCGANNLTSCSRCNLLVLQSELQPISPVEGLWCQKCVGNNKKDGQDHLGRLIEEYLYPFGDISVRKDGNQIRIIEMLVSESFAKEFLAFLITKK